MHKLTYHGQDVFCVICGQQWSIDEVAPDKCAIPAAVLPAAAPSKAVVIDHRLRAYLTGPKGAGRPAVLVFAMSEDGATDILSTVTGIHGDDLTAARAERMDGFCRVLHPCPSFNPMDLQRAEDLCADILESVFGTTRVVNPFHYKSKDKPCKI